MSINRQQVGTYGESSFLLRDALPQGLVTCAYPALLDEVSWQKMYSFGSEVPRLVAAQHIANQDGDVPVYRHPTDRLLPSTALSQTVSKIVLHLNEMLKTELNHVLIQHYRSGHDSISEHSDKTLDVDPDSVIVNVSFGSTRVMTLRPKANKLAAPDDGSVSCASKRENERIELPHGSIFVMSLATNMNWTHAIRPNRSSTETIAGRISLTVRKISTFLTTDGLIYGGGTPFAARDRAQPVVYDRSRESDRDCWDNVLHGFSRENKFCFPEIEGLRTEEQKRQRHIWWTQWYGDGSCALPCQA